MKIGKRDVRLGMLPLMSVVVFCALAVNATISSLIVFTLIQGDVFTLHGTFSQVAWRLILIHVAVSLIIGVLISLGAVAVLLRPVRNLISSMNRLAGGDFGARIQVGPVMKKSRTFVAAAESSTPWPSSWKARSCCARILSTTFPTNSKRPLFPLRALPNCCAGAT